jgi:hypothetical protein
VVLYGGHADAAAARDVLVGHALGDVAGDLLFAAGQPGKRRHGYRLPAAQPLEFLASRSLLNVETSGASNPPTRETSASQKRRPPGARWRPNTKLSSPRWASRMIMT